MLALITSLLTIFLLTHANVVRTSNGYVSGRVSVSRNNVKYFAYFGIPYAKPPIGELRFEDPKEAEPWRGVKKGDIYPSACPQAGWSSDGGSGDEDCLYLNVFTPLTNDFAGELPVMVWIYGGGFVMGESSIYGADYIMDKNVILVTFNYRVGALGFLSTDTEDLRGNYGMKDQVAALQWVQRNIRAFGGNPGQVTIAGSSAGGASVHWHMHSRWSKGLFHQAISQSGTARSIWSEVPSHIARQRAITFATLAGCYHGSIGEMVKCLRDVPVRDIISIQRKFKVWKHSSSVFGVVVNEKFESSFVTKSPWSRNAVVNEVPWLVGFTSDEGATLISGLLSKNGAEIDDVNVNRRRILPVLLSLDYYSNIRTYDDVTNLTNVLIRRYFGNEEISVKTVANLKDMVADSYLLYDTTESVLNHEAKKYFYVYDHINERSFAEFEGEIVKDGLGAVHCDDLISLFNTSYFPQNLAGVDRQVSEFMVDLWTNFVIYGDPNGEKLALWKPVESDDELTYLRISQHPTMESWTWKERYEFWQGLDLQHGSQEEDTFYCFHCLLEITDMMKHWIGL